MIFSVCLLVLGTRGSTEMCHHASGDIHVYVEGNCHGKVAVDAHQTPHPFGQTIIDTGQDSCEHEVIRIEPEPGRITTSMLCGHSALPSMLSTEQMLPTIPKPKMLYLAKGSSARSPPGRDTGSSVFCRCTRLLI